MDIAAMSIGLNQAKLAQQVSVSVMKKVMDTSQQQASFINEMVNNNVKAMEKSVNHHLGNVIDIRL
ncbi:YjfB family protein [Tepidibacter thalassicus]|uniref:Putative motility protein n=1 Tax=Tepidibacter thalassicus DSM 15285 TaxID=1123350 RepID=A0A1M5R4J9_9FIRM|nr:YjfB family protein [Tepidibacter thalassicus]SHH20960.1 Putative motility protein [Tepidibacter thalassicus DSM 15285]